MQARRPVLDPALETALIEAIAGMTGSPARIAQISEVGGGSISRAFRLQTTNAHYFLKLNAAEQLHHREVAFPIAIMNRGVE